jgi:hypothetical protein
VVRADIFEVVSSHAPKYLLGSLLTAETPSVKLGKGESFTLKMHKNFVVITGGECKCKPTYLSCLAKCLATGRISIFLFTLPRRGKSRQTQ